MQYLSPHGGNCILNKLTKTKPETILFASRLKYTGGNQKGPAGVFSYEITSPEK